jgi:hypothetical protein
MQDKLLVQNRNIPKVFKHQLYNNLQFKPKSTSLCRFLKFLKDQRPIILL